MNTITGNKTSKILLATEEEVFDKIISSDHPFRKLNTLIDFTKLAQQLIGCYSTLGKEGLPVEKGFKALLVQYWEDYSDREMEKALRENMSVRWFCGFGLTENTPDHSYFGKLRKRIGPSKLADIFKTINAVMEEKGLFGNVFAFIDASSIITKTALWEERDRAIRDGAEKLNNANVSKYAADTEARWGAKSKTNIWFGYKRHNAVDMRFGLISKLAVTPANVMDFKTVKNGTVAKHIFLKKVDEVQRCLADFHQLFSFSSFSCSFLPLFEVLRDNPPLCALCGEYFCRENGYCLLEVVNHRLQKTLAGYLKKPSESGSFL